jgi:hypothetical protein
MIRLLAFLLLLSTPVFAQPAANPNPSFNLVNKSGQAIKELLVSPAGRANFGQNRLPNGPIASGASFAVRLLADGNCIFDIRAVLVDGTKQDRHEVNTCKSDDVIITTGTAAPGPTPAPTKATDDPSFRLNNRGSQAVAELFATPAGKPRGANLLDTPLAAKTDRAIKIDKAQGCLFDLRVVLADKSAKERKATNLCKVTELPIP